MKYFLLLSSICFSLSAFEKGVFFESKLLNLNSSKFKATVLGIEMDWYVEDHLLNEKFVARARAGFRVETGTSSSTYSDFNEFKDDSHIYLYEAFVRWSPWSFFDISAGAINQKIHESKLFLDSIPFLTLLETLKYGNKRWQLVLQGQQSLPKNSNLASRFGTIDEGAPLFFSEKIKGKLIFKKWDIDFSVQHFAFDKLSRAVAYKSLFMGNSTVGSGSTGTIFQYSFIGWEGTFGIDLKTIRTKLSISAVHNGSAPQGKNSGFIISGEWVHLLGNIDLTMGGDFFRNESDTMPGFYTDKYYGHQNRQGFSLFSSLTIPQFGKLSLQFVNAKKLDFHPFQVDEQIALMTFQRKVL